MKSSLMVDLLLLSLLSEDDISLLVEMTEASDEEIAKWESLEKLVTERIDDE